LRPFFSSMLLRRHRSKLNPPLAGRSIEPVILPAVLHRKGTATSQGHGESPREGAERVRSKQKSLGLGFWGYLVMLVAARWGGRAACLTYSWRRVAETHRFYLINKRVSNKFCSYEYVIGQNPIPIGYGSTGVDVYYPYPLTRG
jgi:hypothetical protein